MKGEQTLSTKALLYYITFQADKTFYTHMTMTMVGLPALMLSCLTLSNKLHKQKSPKLL